MSLSLVSTLIPYFVAYLMHHNLKKKYISLIKSNNVISQKF